MPQSEKNLIWIDLEMTGLDTDNDHIIEIATIVTNSELDILAEGPVYAIHQPDSVINKMDTWNTEHHGKSGLIDRIRESKIDNAEAETETLRFLEQYVPINTSPMCGNSICQDRRFLHRLMPQLEKYFHYRNLDVSTLKVLAQHWSPKIVENYNKVTQHTALQDIRDSIEELRYYRDHFIKVG